MKTFFILIPIVILLTINPVSAQTEYITKDGYLAAGSEEDFDKATKYLIDEDYDSLQILLDDGKVIKLKKDLIVFVVDSHVRKGKVEIRPKDYDLVLWTNTEAIKKKKKKRKS